MPIFLKFKNVWMPLTVLALLIGYQNCGRVQFGAIPSSYHASLANAPVTDGNGSGYEGKPGTYYRTVPEHTCEGRPAVHGFLTVASATSVTLTSNKKNKCGVASGAVAVDQLQPSPFFGHLLGYHEGIYEFHEVAPDPASRQGLVEAWCVKLDSAQKGVEVVVRTSSVEGLVAANVYRGEAGPPAVRQEAAVPDVKRRIQEKTVYYDGAEFHLELDVNRPVAGRPGQFLGRLRGQLFGASLDEVVNCQTGGPLDGVRWPSKQITDLETRQYSLALNKSSIAFLSNFETGLDQLYTTDLLGVPPVRLNPALPPGSQVFDFRLTPDSSRAVYRANGNGPIELFSVEMNAANLVQLNAPLVGANQSVLGDYQISDDGLLVTYRDGSLDATDPEEWLFSVRIDGSQRSLLSPNVVMGDPYTLGNAMVPGGSRIAYVYSTSFFDTSIYVSDLDGRNASKLIPSPALPAGSALSINRPRFSPDGSRIYYDLTTPTMYVTSALDGTGTVLLGRAAIQKFSPDGQRALFYDWAQGGRALLAAPDGSRRADLPVLWGEHFTRDSSKIVYSPKNLVSGARELFVANVDGSGQRKISGDATVEGQVLEFLPRADSSGAYYWARRGVDGVNQLYFVSWDGRPAVRVEGASFVAQTLTDFRISPDGKNAFVRADRDGSGRKELIFVRLAETAASSSSRLIRIDTSFAAQTDVLESEFLPDSNRVLFRARQLGSGEINLFLWDFSLWSF
ncbi:MAG: hypothetical protein NDI61_08610 [Bdellovibrionaceae bacterium]|nr:hypothetical protein [Pseudobdellovibrionaceae bacterium]